MSNGFTKFGMFSLINDDILKGEKLKCNGIDSTDNTCQYCCKD